MYANGRSYYSAGHEYDRRMTTHRSCGAHPGKVLWTLPRHSRRTPETGSRERFPALVLGPRTQTLAYELRDWTLAHSGKKRAARDGAKSYL